MAVLLANMVRQQGSTVGRTIDGPYPAAPHASLGKVLHESFTDGAQLLLLGALVVGVVTGASGEETMRPFASDLFKGMLAFFLLHMGLQASRHLGSLRGSSPWLVAYAVIAPFARTRCSRSGSARCPASRPATQGC